MRVAATLVVGGHHLRLELPHRPYQRLGGHLDRDQGETALRKRRRRITLGEPGIHEPEPRLPDPENLPRAAHLLPAQLGQPRPDVRAGPWQG